MAMIHYEVKEGSKRVACGMRKIGLMGMRCASHWVELKDAKHIECKACRNEAAGHLARKALESTDGSMSGAQVDQLLPKKLEIQKQLYGQEV